ncbi:hypothetical protein OQA88_13084 [Cercophora sp. LCS_1]
MRQAVLLALATLAAAASLPYIPTTVLLSGAGAGEDDVAYIFATRGEAVSLLSLNISAKLSGASLQTQTITSGLPFLGDRKNIAFTPSVLADGTLAVFAGDCSVATDAAVWTLPPGSSGTSAWTKHATAQSNTWDYGQGGPYFLGGGLSFSAQLAPVVSEPVFYVYGGMCPWTNGSASGQSTATYSNRMLKITPPGGSTKAYTVSYAPSAGPPIAEAGFTFTALTPSITNRSGIITQQTSHVLLGGHTQQAFINMSTAAIWSLPEETWNFVSIAAPATTSRTDLLAAKDTSSGASDIDSRSGHTTILSEDGSSLVILGGWVGDINTPAEPQLGIIKIGALLSDWQWSIPTSQPSSGIYGHGAALLPGNVMMVYGGYSINTKKHRRQSSNKLFFNITSLSWSDTYTNPLTQHSVPPSSNPSGNPTSDESSSTSSNPTSLGLGLGLGLGVPVLALLILLAFYLRRRHLRRQERDEALRSLAQGVPPMLEAPFPPWDADSARDWYTGGSDPYTNGRRSLGYETLRGAQNQRPVYLPPPRPRPAVARGLYQPSTSMNGGFHPLSIPKIHPIYEDDEEDNEDKEVDLGTAVPDDDPFATPTRSQPATPTKGVFPQAPEVQTWVGEVDAADAVLEKKIKRAGSTTTTPPRFLSTKPEEHERTESNLSDASAFSFVAGAERYLTGARGAPGTSSSGESYSTAKSSFAVLQAEGPSLLSSHDDNDDDNCPGSPSKNKVNRKSWLGSFKRVFSGSSPSLSSRGDSPTGESLLDGGSGGGSDYEPRLVGMGPGGTLLRRKQGREAWGEQGEEDEWDVERAVEQRLVQVMFTVPKERLRVVNADVGEVGVIEWDSGSSHVGSHEEEGSIREGASVKDGRDSAMEMGTRNDNTDRQRDALRERDTGRNGREKEAEEAARLLFRPENDGKLPAAPGISPSASLRTASITTTTPIYMAESVRLERPRTRVLEMVESIESKSSRGSSPAGSPSREK